MADPIPEAFLAQLLALLTDPDPDAYHPVPRDRAAERARLEATRPGYREARTVGDAFGPEAREAWEPIACKLEQPG